jgi:LEA14-like dessication related protein
MKSPDIRGVERIDLVDLQDSLLRVDFTMNIFNPNKYDVSISSSEIETFYSGISVGQGTIEAKTVLKGNDVTSVKTQTWISLPQMAHLYPELLALDTAKFDIVGKSKIKFYISNLSINFDQSIRLNTREIILSQINRNLKDSEFLKVTSVSVDQLPALNRTKFKVSLEIQNNMPFAYTLEQLDINMHLQQEDEPVALWTQSLPVIQAASSISELPLELTVDNFTLIKQMDITKILENERDIFLQGNAKVLINEYAFNVPIQVKKQVTFPFLFD